MDRSGSRTTDEVTDSGCPAIENAGRKAPFLLVHGTWHGGWCWDEVARILRARGHEVWTPTLPAIADGSWSHDETIDLNSHIRAVVSLIDHEDLRDLVLVGHSYGGMVISGVSDQRAERLCCVVFLDALLPNDGDSVATLLPADRWLRYEAAAKGHGSGRMIPPPDAKFLGLSEELAGRITPRLTPQPLATFQELVRLPNGGAHAVRRRVYIGCDEPGMETFDAVKRVLRADPHWEYHTIATGHDAMLSAPNELAAMLLEVAGKE